MKINNITLKINVWYPEGLQELLEKGKYMFEAYRDTCPHCKTRLIPPEISKNKCLECGNTLIKGDNKTMTGHTIKAILPNGVVVEGPAKEVQALLRAHGVFVPDGVHYKSSHQGIIRIDTMTNNHLMNAIRRIYRKWVDELDPTTMTRTQFVTALKSGPTTDVTLLALVAELNKRK